MVQRTVSIVLLLHCLSAIGLAQKNNDNNELKHLREEFIKATNEYKESLTKLLALYEGNVKRAEEVLEQSRKSLAEGLTSRIQVEENERKLAAAKNHVAETQRQIANADAQIAGIFAETQLEQEYKRAVKQRRRARKPKCSNWTLTAYQRSTPKSISFGYKLVCLN